MDLIEKLVMEIRMFPKEKLLEIKNQFDNTFKGIYFINNLITHKIYLGSTETICRREWGHFRDLELQQHHSVHLQRAYNKSGRSIDDFIFIPYEEILLPKNYVRGRTAKTDLIFGREQEYLTALKSLPLRDEICYNVNFTVSGCHVHDLPLEVQEQRGKRISITSRAQYANGTRTPAIAKGSVNKNLKGRIHINNEIEAKMIWPDELPEWEDKGYKKGKGKLFKKTSSGNHGKTWEITCPDGSVIITSKLVNWCKEMFGDKWKSSAQALRSGQTAGCMRKVKHEFIETEVCLHCETSLENTWKPKLTMFCSKKCGTDYYWKLRKLTGYTAKKLK